MAKFDPKALNEFAKSYGFHYSDVNTESLIQEIILEMEKGLSISGSSLAMIPSYISPPNINKIPAGKTVLALDAGGTNLRTSLISFNDKGEAIPENTKKSPMPGTNGKLNAKDFFDAIADACLPLFNSGKKIEGIGFTFSYPMEITENADGILLGFSKEVDAPDVVGKQIGKGLREALAQKGCVTDVPIVLLNDTVATLLSGIASISPDGEPVRSSNDFNAEPAPVIGFILGTGFNTAYPELNIPKINYKEKETGQIIVCESGNLNAPSLLRGKLDKEFDATTTHPGTFLLEKATSGAYLGPLSLTIFKQAIKDKLLTFKKQEEMLAMQTLETRFLNEFYHAPLTASGPIGSLFDKDEKDALATLQYLTSLVTERGAVFSAAVVAATIKKVNHSCQPFSPVRIAVEGTTYLIYKGMRRALESHLHQMLYKKGPIPYVMQPVEQASLFGAAVAALSK